MLVTESVQAKHIPTCTSVHKCAKWYTWSGRVCVCVRCCLQTESLETYLCQICHPVWIDFSPACRYKKSASKFWIRLLSPHQGMNLFALKASYSSRIPFQWASRFRTKGNNAGSWNSCLLNRSMLLGWNQRTRRTLRQMSCACDHVCYQFCLQLLRHAHHWLLRLDTGVYWIHLSWTHKQF